MQTLIKLFGKSPFSPLRAHLEIVSKCVLKVPVLFDLLIQGDYEGISELVKEISFLEHQADETKNSIRNHLYGGLILPIKQEHLLEILSIQDNLADKAEDIGILLTFRKLELKGEIKEMFLASLKINMEAFELVRRVCQEFDNIIESSFGGKEAGQVCGLIQEVAVKEHEADVLQRDLLKFLFSEEDNRPVKEFFLWISLIKEISSLSNEAEKLANRIRMILEVK